MSIPIESLRGAFHDLEYEANDGKCDLSESHIKFMVSAICHAFINGCAVEREKKMMNGKLIVTFAGVRIFTIRSIKSGMWCEFKDPNNNLLAENPEKRPTHCLTLKHHETENQFRKYQMNKTGYFQDGDAEFKDVCALIESSISLHDV